MLCLCCCFAWLVCFLQVELSCDASLFFHYSANVSSSAYEDIKVWRTCCIAGRCYMQQLLQEHWPPAAGLAYAMDHTVCMLCVSFRPASTMGSRGKCLAWCCCSSLLASFSLLIVPASTLANQCSLLPLMHWQEDCGLVVDFASFPALLLKLLNLLVEQPSTYLGLLVLRADGSAVLEFAQNLEFKAMSLLSMRVEAVPQVSLGRLLQCLHGQ